MSDEKRRTLADIYVEIISGNFCSILTITFIRFNFIKFLKIGFKIKRKNLKKI